MENTNKSNKILFVTNQAPAYRVPLFNELAKRLNIKFIFTHEKKDIKGLEVDYTSLKGIGYKKFRIHPELPKIIKKENPSMVVLLPPDPLHLINNKIMFNYLKKKKIPFSMVVGRWEHKEKPLKQKITEPFHDKIMKKADYLIAYGTKTKKWLLKKEIKKENIKVAYNINPYVYENLDEKKKKLPELKNKKVVLYVGRLLKVKGVDYLIRAFSKIKYKNAILVLVGGGDFYNLGAKSEEKELRDLVKKLGIEKKVVFTGHLLREKTKKYYKSADVFVCPSITYKQAEAWGHVVEEAMSFELPVITTDAVGAGYDLIKENKNGFIVPEKNSEELKKRIEKILKDKKLRDKMGKESLRIIKQDFKYEDILKTWEEVLGE